MRNGQSRVQVVEAPSRVRRFAGRLWRGTLWVSACIAVVALAAWAGHAAGGSETEGVAIGLAIGLLVIVGLVSAIAGAGGD